MLQQRSKAIFLYFNELRQPYRHTWTVDCEYFWTMVLTKSYLSLKKLSERCPTIIRWFSERNWAQTRTRCYYTIPRSEFNKITPYPLPYENCMKNLLHTTEWISSNEIRKVKWKVMWKCCLYGDDFKYNFIIRSLSSSH